MSARGATFYAVAVSVCHICKCIFNSVDTALTVSSMMHGEYGLEDVCLTPCPLWARNGSAGKIVTPLTDHEMELLHKSADCLKEVINGLTF